MTDTAREMARVLRTEGICSDEQDAAVLALIRCRYRPQEIEANLELALDAVRQTMAEE